MDIFSPKPLRKPPVYPRIKPQPASSMNIFSPKPQSFGLTNAAPKGTLPEFVPPQARYAPAVPNVGSFFPVNNRGFSGNGKTHKRRPFPKKMENMDSEPLAPNRALSPPTIRPSIRLDRRKARTARRRKSQRK